jgi:hypothetical protein
MDTNNLNTRIEETLASLDNIKRAEANPFLLTRIKERMNKPAPGVFKRITVWQMASCMLLVLGLNLAIGVYVYNSDSISEQPAESAYFNNHVYTY